jgi:hypothetical protein
MVERDKGRYIDEQLLFVVVVLFVPFVVLFVIKDEKLRLGSLYRPFSYSLFSFDNQTTTRETQQKRPPERYQGNAYSILYYSSPLSPMHKTNRQEQEEKEIPRNRLYIYLEIGWRVFQGFCQVFSRCRFDS